MPSAFLRLLHSLQYFGQVMPCGIFPAALSAFQSVPQARSRATMASRPPVATVQHGRDAVLACLLVREAVYRKKVVTAKELAG